MGILLEEKTVQREKRYMGLTITKNRLGVNSGSITIATGYYDSFAGITEWVTEKEETINLSNDQLTALFVVKPAQVGLTAATTTLFQLLDKSIYAVISGQIPIHAALTVVVKDKDGVALTDYSIVITRPSGHVFSSYAMNNEPQVLNTEVVIGATVTIQKYGYEVFTKTYPALMGPVTLNAALVAAVVSEPEQPEVPPAPAE